jgi:hypothetical protein
MVTIDDTMPFRVLICDDVVVSLMSIHVFLNLQILILSLTSASHVQGPGGDVVETHDNIVLPITFGVTEGFRTILINFFIVDLMLPYEAIITFVAYQVVQVPAPPGKSPALVPAMGSSTWSPH